ncbi:MAG: flagellar hook-associated protein FlgK [Sulfuriflexus sp.]|nr:flagellar hook-associated protein FlgK [Sulfuriflexus sp.]
MASLNNIGVSGLLAFQQSLGTVSHNIANSTTEGYSRQRTGLTARVADSTGVGFFGTGVKIQGVTRVYDQFVLDRLQTNTSNYSQAEHFLGLVSQVDNLLADESAGLTPALQNFFNSLQNSVDDPASAPAREVFLSDADALVQRFQSIDNRLRQLGIDAENDLVNVTNEINGLGRALARVNESIVLESGSGTGNPPNDLLDKRDGLLRELAELTSVKTVTQTDGSLNIFIGTGQGLVVGSTVNELNAVRSKFDPERLDIVVQQGGIQVDVTSQLTGGRLGAVIDFRNNVLEPGLNSLGRVATGLAATFNAQHQLGIDLNGNIGQAFFNVSPVDVAASNGNVGTGNITAAITNVANFTASDYEVVYDGSNYRVTRLKDSKNVFTGDLATLNATPIDGFQLTVTAGAVAGDTFQVQPTRNSARNIAVLIKDNALIAHASPIRSTSAITNTGNLKFNLGGVSRATTFPIAADITLVFDPNAAGAGVPGFIISGGPGGAIAYDPTNVAEVSGKSFTLASPFDGITFTVSGTPSTGDSVTIANNTNGVGDNRNGLLLGQLQNKITLLGNNTFQSSFGELVADVGIRTRQGQITEETQLVLLRQNEAERESISGVNLDEEAAKLLQLQQAYQAAARVVTIANSLFDEILAALR